MKTQTLTTLGSIGKSICLLIALVALQSAAIANTILTFQSTSGESATGTLILGQPLNQTQTPLSGSTFTTVGVTFDLTLASWLGGGNQTLIGDIGDLPTFTGLTFVPQTQPIQDFFLVDFFDFDFFVFAEGSGKWVVPASSGVPDAGSTLAMFGLALAGCIGLRRRCAN